jgi:hypothetical protein
MFGILAAQNGAKKTVSYLTSRHSLPSEQNAVQHPVHDAHNSRRQIGQTKTSNTRGQTTKTDQGQSGSSA